MHRPGKLLIIVALLVAGLAVGTAWAADQAGYDLSWWTVDAGGTTFSTADGYTVGATVGQPDAGVLSGNGYTLAGGFWGGGVVARRFQLYLPLMLRGH